MRHLDWRAYLRFDRLLLRMFEEHGDLAVYILLDCSRSMAPTPGADGRRKFDAARRLAAALAYIALATLDRVTLAPYSSHAHQVLGPLHGSRQVWRALDFLANLDTGGDTRLDHAVRQVFAAGRRRGLVILISDLLSDTTEGGLDLLLPLRHDVAVLPGHRSPGPGSAARPRHDAGRQRDRRHHPRPRRPHPPPPAGERGRRPPRGDPRPLHCPWLVLHPGAGRDALRGAGPRRPTPGSAQPGPLASPARHACLAASPACRSGGARDLPDPGPPRSRCRLPPTLLWRRLLAARRRRHDRLRWLISLLLAMTVAGCLALAASQAPWLQPGGGDLIALAFDSSPTMRAALPDGTATRIDLAVAEARRIVAEADAGSRFTLGADPTPLTPAEALLALSGSFETEDAEGGPEPAIPAANRVYLFTDGTSAWKPITDPATATHTVSVLAPARNAGIVLFVTRPGAQPRSETGGAARSPGDGLRRRHRSRAGRTDDRRCPDDSHPAATRTASRQPLHCPDRHQRLRPRPGDGPASDPRRRLPAGRSGDP